MCKMSAEEGKNFEVRSTCSRSSMKSSKSSHRSMASLAAIEARAKAEAARARAAYAQKEIEVKVKQAQLKVEETRLEATLEALKEEKEAEAALAEATVFEAAADVAISERLSRSGITQPSPSFDSLERTKNYVHDQMSGVKNQAEAISHHSLYDEDKYSHPNRLHSLYPSTTSYQCIPADVGISVSESVFCNTKEDDKPAPSVEDLAFLKLMDKEVY
ncbi:hypothetical protein MHYP_G00043340 [Metynnis hypsauchen]